MKIPVSLNVNGTSYAVLVEPEQSLADTLRVDLGLPGTKRACNEGECGSCTVLLDGLAVNSCLTLAVQAQHRAITTIEGLARGGELHPVQRAFVEHHAAQCGYCTPGMILTAASLLAANPSPSEQDIKQAIRGNLCRCTGYTKIVEAIQAAAGAAPPRPAPPSSNGYSVVGKSLPRVDALEKVTGKAAYVFDMALPGMLWGEILRSPYPHARITRIDASRARAHPGVMAVVTGADFASYPKFGAFVQDETALAIDRVRYAGEGVAAVCAIDERTALDALELIDVDYEPLPGVFDPEAAMQESAPPVHDGVERNVVAHNRVIGGDIEKGFAEADFVFEDRFVTSRQCHVCMEPHGCIVDYDATGRMTFWMSTQSTFFERFALMGILGLPAAKIRIIAPYLGGGFGSKSEPHSIYLCAAYFARVTGRPVKMVHSRDEEFISSRTRHPQVLYIKTGVKKDGTITARQGRVILDNGAYTSYGPGVSLTESMLGGALYRLPAYRYDGYVVYTNNPFGGAFRGFGSPQWTFAVESHTDMVAERLGMDPVEFRLKNLHRAGEKAISGPTLTTCGVADALQMVADRLDWVHRDRLPANHGLGVACGIHFTSGKFHPHVNADFSAAGVKVNEDGSVNLMIGAVEMGTGAATTAMAQICAEELGVGIDDVEVWNSDSELIPADFGTYGSRVTTIGGNAVRLACSSIREQLFRVASEKLQISPDELALGGGRAYVKSDPARGHSLAELVQSSIFRDRDGRQVMAFAHYDAPCDLPDPETGVGDFAQSYSFGVHGVEVEVDPETGYTRVLRLVAGTDCGDLINPALAETQVEGGAAQGLGYALLEDLVCAEGQVLNPRMGTYKIPTVMEMPSIESTWVQTNDPRGPYGAKGLGEMGMVPTAPAVANAVYNATGVRVQELPITPEKVLTGIEARAGGLIPSMTLTEA